MWKDYFLSKGSFQGKRRARPTVLLPFMMVNLALRIQFHALGLSMTPLEGDLRTLGP